MVAIAALLRSSLPFFRSGSDPVAGQLLKTLIKANPKVNMYTSNTNFKGWLFRITYMPEARLAIVSKILSSNPGVEDIRLMKT